jgi:dihydrofolate reductase
VQNLNVIAAVALNGVIGDSKTNSIPWKISADLRRFKQLTTGKIVIMGANTFKSLPNGQALPNRRNVVITRQAFTVEDLSVEYPGIAPRGAYHSFPASIFCEVGEKWVIGGGKIYAEAMEWRPDNLYITIVNLEPEGDVLFPIAGRELDQPSIIHRQRYTGTEVRYTRRSDSGWLEENGVPYKFVEFSIVRPKEAE